MSYSLSYRLLGGPHSQAWAEECQSVCLSVSHVFPTRQAICLTGIIVT
jgi:hypothetical protein